MDYILTGLGAAIAVAVELLEALAITAAVGVGRNWRDALIGGAAALLLCALLGAAFALGLLSSLPLQPLRIVIGALLMIFGLEWLRKGTLRLSGRRERSSVQAEYEETLEDLGERAEGLDGGPDWAARLVAFKGVALEGLEIVLIVGVLASRPGKATAAVIGAIVAVGLAAAAALGMRRLLTRLPETELKWGVGVLLTSFGVFFTGEGLQVDWPGGDVALLYVAIAIGAASLLRVADLARTVRPA